MPHPFEDYNILFRDGVFYWSSVGQDYNLIHWQWPIPDRHPHYVHAQLNAHNPFRSLAPRYYNSSPKPISVTAFMCRHHIRRIWTPTDHPWPYTSLWLLIILWSGRQGVELILYSHIIIPFLLRGSNFIRHSCHLFHCLWHIAYYVFYVFFHSTIPYNTLGSTFWCEWQPLCSSHLQVLCPGTTIRQLEQLYSIHYYTIITLHVPSLLYQQKDPKLPFPVATHTHTNPSHSWLASTLRWTLWLILIQSSMSVFK